MWQALRSHCQMTFDAGDFLAGVIALELCAIGVLHTLRIQDDKATPARATKAGADRANHIFLRPAPTGLTLGQARSRSPNMHKRCATWESLPAPSAIGSRCVTHTTPRKTPHISPLPVAGSVSALIPVTPGSSQIVPCLRHRGMLPFAYSVPSTHLTYFVDYVQALRACGYGFRLENQTLPYLRHVLGRVGLPRLFYG